MVQDGGGGGGGGAAPRGYASASGMVGMLAATLREEGGGALWRGTLPRVAQVAPLSAIAFAVFEGMRSWFARSGLLRGAADAENPYSKA